MTNEQLLNLALRNILDSASMIKRIEFDDFHDADLERAMWDLNIGRAHKLLQAISLQQARVPTLRPLHTREVDPALLSTT